MDTPCFHLLMQYRVASGASTKVCSMCKHSLHVFVLFSHRPALDHFVECHICYSLKQSMYNYLNGVSAALVAKEAFAIHVKDFSNDITQLDRYRDLAVRIAGFLFIMIDGMSQQTTRIPHETRHTGVFGQHIVGAVVNCLIGTFGNLTSEMKHLFLLYDHLAPAGGDETIEILARLLLMLRALNLAVGKSPWPATLYLQVDGARFEFVLFLLILHRRDSSFCTFRSDNKNRTLFAFCALLVQWRWFRSIFVSFLQPSHGHTRCVLFYFLIVILVN